MMDWFEFVRFVNRARRGRSVLARVALNVLVSESRYPLDVSELRRLSRDDLLIVNAFLDWAIAYPGGTLVADHVRLLTSFLKPRVCVCPKSAAGCRNL